MERLTKHGGARTWRLFRIGWYINLALVIFVLLVSAYYLFAAESSEPEASVDNTVMMGAMLIVATILLMGAGISRYEARLEGQHLELKLALNKVIAEIEALKDGPAEPE